MTEAWAFDDEPLRLGKLSRYCELRVLAVDLKADVDKEGTTVVDRFGQVKASPKLVEWRNVCSLLLDTEKSLYLDEEPPRDGPGRPPGT